MSKVENDNHSTMNCSDINNVAIDKYNGTKFENEKEKRKKSKRTLNFKKNLKKAREFPTIPFNQEWIENFPSFNSTNLSRADRKQLIINKYIRILENVDKSDLEDSKNSCKVYTLVEDLRNIIEAYEITETQEHINERRPIKRLIEILRKKFPIPFRSESALAVRYQSIYRHIRTEQLEKILEIIKVHGLGCYLNLVLNSEGNHIYLTVKRSDGLPENKLISKVVRKSVCNTDSSFDSKSSSIQILDDKILDTHSRMDEEFDQVISEFEENQQQIPPSQIVNIYDDSSVIEQKEKSKIVTKTCIDFKFNQTADCFSSIFNQDLLLQPNNSQLNSIIDILKRLNYSEMEIHKITHGIGLDLSNANEFINGNTNVFWGELEDKILSRFKKPADLECLLLLIRYKGIDSVNRRIKYLMDNLQRMDSMLTLIKKESE